MKSGRLRYRATWKTRTVTHGDRGENTATYATSGDGIPCEYQVLSGLELIRARKREATATCKVIMRNSFDINPKDRLIINGLTIEVRAVLQDPNDNLRLEVLGSHEVA